MRTTFCLSAVCVLAHLAFAGDAYYAVPLGDATITQGEIPAPGEATNWRTVGTLHARATIAGGEAYVQSPVASPNGARRFTSWGSGWNRATAMIVARVPDERDASGWLWVPDPTGEKLVRVAFTIPKGKASPDARQDFFDAKAAYYESRWRQGGPGSAWYRHQADMAIKELPEDARVTPLNNRQMVDGGTSLDDTYALFTGGRAVSENLQLTRELPPDRPAPAPGNAPVAGDDLVDVSGISGITVPAMDWKARLAGANPKLDALASLIPHDQHAIFFPSFAAMVSVLDETTDHELPLFRGFARRSEDAGLPARYQRQLGVSAGALARAIGPSLVRSVAVTGSDPYFPTGTDLAVLFETGDAKALRTLLLAQIALNAPKVALRREEIAGVACDVRVTPDRAASSYLGIVGDAVVLANSRVQIERLAAAQGGKVPAIAGLDEYAFFRNRYTLGDKDETAFLFISDPAIRRWCGPEWRIGASRRVRAAAVLCDLTARHLPELQRGNAPPAPVTSDVPMRTIGDLTLDAAGARSSVYGSPDFLTPVAELGITRVARDEAQAYQRWRDGYQRNWSWAFDPIGVRLTLEGRRLAGDLTIMPLIAGSEYRFFSDITRGVSFDARNGDPHESIIQFVLAVNHEAAGFKQSASMMRMMAPKLTLDPLGWLGNSVSLYADADPFWKDLRQAGKIEEFMSHNLGRLPVGLYAEVSGALKLAAFLASLRAWIEESSPGMIAWETRTHHDQPYVRAGLTEKARADARGDAFDNAGVYYAAMPRALVVTLNEDLLKRAIDRELERSKKDAAPAAPAPPWLGQSVAAHVSNDGIDALESLGMGECADDVRRRCWANIEILNEWKRLFPSDDPLKVHERWWGARLICPAGGTYSWNAAEGTVESSALGHPGDPRPFTPTLGQLRQIRHARFGLTFEDDGLRARVEITRDQ